MTDTALIIDTETDQGRDPRPIQVATINVATGFEWMKYFNSGRPISPVVIRIHGITDDDVAGLERFELDAFELPQYLIGHNVRFDWRVIGSPTTKLICTVRLARVACTAPRLAASRSLRALSSSASVSLTRFCTA